MQNGWIKIHRKIQDKCYYKKSAYVHLWLHLLLNANHEPKEFMWNNNILVVKEGQLLTGRKELAVKTGLAETTVERILDFLEKDHQIGQQKTTKFRLITILNWRTYQKEDNKRTTDGQQADTNKNIKNNKKYIADVPSAPWCLEEKLQDMEKTPNSYLDIIATFIREKPVKIENSKQLSNVISRYCRIAKKMEGAYTNKQIFSVAERIKKDNEMKKRKGQEEIDYSLETFYKYLTK